MKNINVRTDLDGIDNTLGISPVFQDKFKNTNVKFPQRFGDVDLLS